MRFEDTEVWGFRKALKGMRNPMNSWDKSDSKSVYPATVDGKDDLNGCHYLIGKNDMKLAQQLIRAGSEHVSDKPYVSNSFHCHVSEQMSPIEKQDKEERFWGYFNGGKIQYCRYNLGYNIEAIKTLVLRAMEKGFYEGVNLAMCYCEDCGYQQVEMDVCPKCGSNKITKIDRMNGYLGFTRVHGETRYNEAKNAEIKDRVSM